MKYYAVLGAKWFDKANGNTYHNAKVIDVRTGETFYTGFAYGYGNAYLESARQAIEKRTKAQYTVRDVGEFYGAYYDVKGGRF